MTTVKDIYDYIDSFAPFDTAESYDNVGILAGDPNQNVTQVLLALDITRAVVREAEKMNAQLIISHHPVIFRPIHSVLKGTAVYDLVQSGISAICAHTNLDKSSEFGVNTTLAAAIGLKNCMVSEKGELLFTAETENEMTAREFALSVKKSVGLDSIAYTDSGKMIKKVGFCSGAGGEEIFTAKADGCDAFVTGELKHHEIVFANENQISAYILGHFGSENVVIKPLAEKLSERFREVTFRVKSNDTDGVKFV